MTTKMETRAMVAKVVAAAEFFQRLNLRDHIARGIEIVCHEARAGRLRWTYEEVKSLIQPCPNRGYDSVLELMGDDRQLDDGEKPYVGEEDGLADSDSDSGMSEWNAPAVAGTDGTENGNARWFTGFASR